MAAILDAILNISESTRGIHGGCNPITTGLFVDFLSCKCLVFNSGIVFNTKRGVLCYLYSLCLKVTAPPTGLK